MKFLPTVLPDAFVIEPELLGDARGFFCSHLVPAGGRKRRVYTRPGCSAMSPCNRACGTLRGMHYQAAPAAESKLVRCTRGSLYDVVIDLRPASPTYRRWVAVELTADKPSHAVCTRGGVPHGFQTLEDNTEVFLPNLDVLLRARHAPRGRAVERPRPFGICWPLPVTVIADRDPAVS